MMRSIVAVVAMFLGLAGFAEPAGATVEAPSGVHAHSNDSLVYDAPDADSVQEPGPPNVAAAHIYDAVGPWSHGTSARPGRLANRPTTVYAYLGTFMRGAGATTTTVATLCSDGDLSSVPTTKTPQSRQTS